MPILNDGWRVGNRRPVTSTPAETHGTCLAWGGEWGHLGVPEALWVPDSTVRPSPDWKTGMAVPRDIAVAYLLQGSFYGHSIYATLYLDAWRKDSVVMLVHHVVTLVLIVSSYAFRWVQGETGGWRVLAWAVAGGWHRTEADPWVRHGSVRGGGFWRETLKWWGETGAKRPPCPHPICATLTSPRWHPWPGHKASVYWTPAMWQVLLGVRPWARQTDPDVPEPAVATICGHGASGQSLSKPQAAVYVKATLIPRQRRVKIPCDPFVTSFTCWMTIFKIYWII